MKFLAIMRDSLREAIDAKVFYVMVGLSVLMIALAATITFKPIAGGDMIAKMATVPLSLDLTDFDPSEFQMGAVEAEQSGEPDAKARGRRGGGGGTGGPIRLMQRVRGQWDIKEVRPVDGAEDLPSSTFRAVLQPSASIPFVFRRPSPEQRLAEIQERFGQWDDVRIVELLKAQHENGTYPVEFRVTDVGRRLWPHEFSLFFGALPISIFSGPVGFQLFALESVLINGFGSWIAILVSVVITAFFIPNMLRKGTVDMLLVKPMHRSTLLLFKYIGGLLFIVINTTIAVGGVWLALSLRSGIWAPGFLISIPVITFFFAILYSVSTLFGVLTRSPIVAILMTVGVWFLLFIVGVIAAVFDQLEKAEEAPVRRNVGQLAATALGMPSGEGPGPLLAVTLLAAQRDKLAPLEKTEYTFAKIIRAVQFVLPRTRDLDTLTTSVMQRDLMMLPKGMRGANLGTRDMTWGESLTVSGVFIALMLGISCWWFATKDY